MKAIFLASSLVSLSCIAAEKQLQNLLVKNNSSQDVTLYYQHDYTRYAVIKALGAENIQLFLPQEVTIHFNQLNFQQQLMAINNTREPLLIQQHNVIGVSQNGALLGKEICFDTHRPNLSVHEKNSTD